MAAASHLRLPATFLIAFLVWWMSWPASAETDTGDWTKDAPGVRHKITIDDLPPPYTTKSANNDPRVVRRPIGAQLHVPPGFKVEGIRERLRLSTIPPHGAEW